MKTIALYCVAAASALFSANAFATNETYCGTPTLGAADDLQPGVPNVIGMEVTSSTNAKVTQVISKFGKHTLTFTYEDSPHIRRIASQVAQASGATQDQQQGGQQQGGQQQGGQQQGGQQQGGQQQG
ncbi:MAG: hypothetical protein IOD12_04115, partial [Silvanigrellales bacterium]|nr:hypothetical protein [Silvanigrellales bacterium]